MLKPNCTQIYVGSKVIGYVQSGTFYKTVKASRHFLRKPPAIAFDKSTLEDAEQAGALIVQVIDQESGEIYKTTIEQIRRDGFTVNRGFGDQIALHLHYWTITQRGQYDQLPLLAGG